MICCCLLVISVSKCSYSVALRLNNFHVGQWLANFCESITMVLIKSAEMLSHCYQSSLRFRIPG